MLWRPHVPYHKQHHGKHGAEYVAHSVAAATRQLWALSLPVARSRWRCLARPAVARPLHASPPRPPNCPAGVAFSKNVSSSTDNIGYIIPHRVVDHFLAEWRNHGTYRGVPSAGFLTQDMENPAQRAFLKVRSFPYSWGGAATARALLACACGCRAYPHGGNGPAPSHAMMAFPSHFTTVCCASPLTCFATSSMTTVCDTLPPSLGGGTYLLAWACMRGGGGCFGSYAPDGNTHTHMDALTWLQVPAECSGVLVVKVDPLSAAKDMLQVNDVRHARTHAHPACMPALPACALASMFHAFTFCS